MNHTNNKTSPHFEPDEYEQRILKTGCAKENEELQLCFAEKKDWRICQKELNKFRDCWKSYQDKNNNKKLQET